MTLAILASSIALVALISITVSRQKIQKKQQENNFWERERRANSIRKKPLDNLDYIRIPVEHFPTHLLQDNEVVMECIEILETLSVNKIVNLTGFSNTDLKLEYGAANLTVLSEYDQNYTLLVRTLQKWADSLMDAGYMEEATVLMEFAVSTNTDVSRTYYCLADYWVSQGETVQIERLINTAENLRSSNKDVIVRNLRKKLS